MCVIVIKEKDKDLPSKSFFYQCWKKNPHGAGFAYAVGNEVRIRKGFMEFEIFYEELLNAFEEFDLKSKNILIHFRIRTSGLTDEYNCHPFPITSDANQLRKKEVNCECAVAHNGTIQIFNNVDKILNDTQLFIKNVLSVFAKADSNFYQNKDYLDTIERLSNYQSKSKFAFMDKLGNITTIGEFFSYQRVLVSNLNFIQYSKKSNTSKLGMFNTKETFPIVSRKYIEDVEEEKINWSDIRNNLIILEDYEKITSEDGIATYENNTEFKYGYDPISGELYEINDEDRICSFVDYIEL